jgi:aminoacrylate hydrolase
MVTAQVNGLTYDIHDSGKPGAPTVLLSSGLGGAAAYWGAQVPELVAAGYRVLAYDQRGTGRSRGPLPAEYSIAAMAQDVAEILEHSATAQCHFIGHALGGLVGLELALTAPAKIASLSLINAWSAVSKHSLRCFTARLALLDAYGTDAYVNAQPLFLYPAAWSEEHFGDIEKEVAHAIAHFPGADIMKARIGALKAFNVSARLAEITAPVWLSASRDDVLVPWTASEQLANSLTNATFELAPFGAHAHNVTEPATFNRSMLAFLATTTQQQ